jgi:phosphonate transport system permease protein
MNARHPAQFCVACLLAWGAVLLAVVVSFAYLKLDFGGLVSAESRGHMSKFVTGFFPPETSPAFLRKVAWGALETIAISLIGTLIAAIAGLALALPASGRYGAGLKALTRFLLNLLRSVPELVWAVLMVLAAGLGPFAGTLALALHTAGVLGRLFAESLENVRPEPERALLESGSGAVSAFWYGTWPLILPQVVAYSLYRWEMNIRMAAILGFVGAGGLGTLLYFHLSIMQLHESATVILGMIGLVIVVDLVSAFLRKGLVAAHQ